MTKKIAVINDLSGFGRCSLTAAISVLSVMGVQACPLPTALLTAQTGYPSYYCDDYTDKMEHYRSEWLKMKQHFDGIYTGFVASEKQIHQIFRFIDSFHEPGTLLLVDPVMGDNGKTYDMYTPALLQEMKRLAMNADIITPNLTEACLLTGSDYQTLSRLPLKERLDKISQLGRELCSGGPSDIIVTGIDFQDSDGVNKIGNMWVHNETAHLYSFPHIGGSYSGTGDLFASCIAAGTVNGISLDETIPMAGSFLEAALADTVREGVPRNDGVNYEQYLSLLLPDFKMTPTPAINSNSTADSDITTISGGHTL